jgi:hypothetical protein
MISRGRLRDYAYVYSARPAAKTVTGGIKQKSLTYG